MSTAAAIVPRRKIVGPNHGESQISATPWNEPRIVTGGALGGLFVRDPLQSDGWGLIDAGLEGTVLVGGGATAMPAWSSSPTLTSLTVGTLTADAITGTTITGGTITGGTITGSIIATGPMKLANNVYLQSRNAGNTADVNLIGLDVNNTVNIAPSGVQETLFGFNVVVLGNVKVPPNALMYWVSAVQMKGVGGGQLNLLSDVGANIGIGLDVAQDGVLKIRNRAQTADAALVCGNLIASGTFDVATLTTTAIGVRTTATGALLHLNPLYSGLPGIRMEPSYLVDPPVAGTLECELGDNGGFHMTVNVAGAPYRSQVALKTVDNGFWSQTIFGSLRVNSIAMLKSEVYIQHRLIAGDYDLGTGGPLELRATDYSLLTTQRGEVLKITAAGDAFMPGPLRIGVSVASGSPGATDGDLVVARGTISGAIYFGASGTKYLFYDGTDYAFTGTIRPATGVGCDLGTPTYRWTNAYLYASLAIGDNPATTGAIRLPNAGQIIARKADNTNDYRLLRFNPSNQVEIGDGATDIIYNGYDVKAGPGYVAIGTNPASAGSLRLKNATYVISRNGANTADIAMLGLHSDDVIYMGSSGCVGICPYNPATALGIGSAPWASLAIAGAASVGSIVINNTISLTAAAAVLTCSGDIISNGDNGFKAPAIGGFYWQGRTFIACPASGQLLLYNSAGSIGVGLDFATDGILKVRTRAFTADASIIASTIYLSDCYMRFGNRGLLQATSDGYFTIGNNANTSLAAFIPISDNTASLGATAARWVVGCFGNSVLIGTNVAATGAVRLGNGLGVFARNAANTADARLLDLTAGNIIRLGDPAFSTIVYGQLVVDSAAPFNINTSYITGGENPGGLGAPAAGGFQIYARNTGGKTELIAVFNTGGAIRLAIQP